MSLLRKVRLYNITSYVPTQTHEINQIILDNMNKFELSAILYYADFLSMQQKSVPVTDTCKYFYIHKIPMNISYIAGVDPVYDKHSPYVVQATETYKILKKQFGEDGILSFLDNICNLGVSGCVTGESMLKHTHRDSDRYIRSKAYKKYNEFKQNQSYHYVTQGEHGPETKECTKYVAHVQAKINSNRS